MAGLSYSEQVFDRVTDLVAPRPPSEPGSEARGRSVIELFAGVGGFRIALERSGWQVTWSNQWEPATKAQHAFDCYVRNDEAGRFPSAGAFLHEAVNDDIEKVLDEVEVGDRDLPWPSLVVGGFPCQDYSVAKTLNQARGLQGKKGVLWWQIHRLLTLRRPPYLFLENVDRLLKSPANQRGRDFAIMLASLSDLGYDVEWRVANAADYGFPQKRRRVYIVGRLRGGFETDPVGIIHEHGVLARALPIEAGPRPLGLMPDFTIPGALDEITESFGTSRGGTPFRAAGFMTERQVWTRDIRPAYAGPREVLADVLEPTREVPEEYFIPDRQLPTWRYLKGAKHEQRLHKDSGTPYFYSEGPIPYPDRTDWPSRTILTGEGGTSPSRFKHLIEVEDGRLRRLTPRELERLNGFPDDWTAGMSDGRRAFCMGNALVVGLVERIGTELIRQADIAEATIAAVS
jgi:DNA (cytosine-5)-methyltransferase 1